MYDVNPLGPIMHLKELERQTAAVNRKAPRKRGLALRPLLLAMLRHRQRVSLQAVALKARSP